MARLSLVLLPVLHGDAAVAFPDYLVTVPGQPQAPSDLMGAKLHVPSKQELDDHLFSLGANPSFTKHMEVFQGMDAMNQVVAHLQTEIGLAMQADDVFHCAQDSSCLQVWTTADALAGKTIRITQVLGSWNMSEVGVGNVCHANSKKDAVFCHKPLDAYKSGLSWLAMGVPDDSPLQQPLPVGVRCHDMGPSSADAPCHLLSGNEFMVARTERINTSTLSDGRAFDSPARPAIVSLGWSGSPRPGYFSDPDEVLCLDVAGGDGYNGALIQLWDCGSENTQKFTTNFLTFVPSYYGPLTFHGDGTDRGCIDVPGGNLAEGQTMWIWECQHGPDLNPNQMWARDNWGDNSVGNLNIYDDWCLERPEGASDGDVPFLMPCSGSWAQQWKVSSDLSRQVSVSV